MAALLRDRMANRPSRRAGIQVEREVVFDASWSP
jgi:hypothetical protein